jgi:hypothetical protein
MVFSKGQRRGGLETCKGSSASGKPTGPGQSTPSTPYRIAKKMGLSVAPPAIKPQIALRLQGRALLQDVSASGLSIATVDRSLPANMHACVGSIAASVIAKGSVPSWSYCRRQDPWFPACCTRTSVFHLDLSLGPQAIIRTRSPKQLCVEVVLRKQPIKARIPAFFAVPRDRQWDAIAGCCNPRLGFPVQLRVHAAAFQHAPSAASTAADSSTPPTSLSKRYHD